MWEGAERRRKALLLAGGMALLAALLVVLAADGIIDVTRALAEGRPTVAVNGTAFAMPLLALVIAGWATWAFKARGGPPPPGLEAKLLRASLVALAVMVATPLAVGAWAEASLPERGYRPCPDADRRGRFQTVTWARDLSLCSGNVDPA